MNQTLNLQIRESADESLREQLVQHLRAFNDQASDWHRAIRSQGGQPLDVYAFNGDDRLIGGLVGETYWGWLAIDYLWVAPAHRHAGLGSLLLLEAETIAFEQRSCQWAKVSSFSFQAPQLYLNLGYDIAGELKDYPPGETMFWLRKELGHT